MRILAHDIDGQPIVAGDKCMVLRGHKNLIGQTVVIDGPAMDPSLDLSTDYPGPGPLIPWVETRGAWVRRITNRPETVTWESMRGIWTPREIGA